MGPVLFNIFHCDLLRSIESSYFANYADDITPSAIGNDGEVVVSELKIIGKKLFIWFAQNEMKENLDKPHLLLSTSEKLLIFKYQRQ